MAKKGFTFKHNSGDNQETYDWYLWVDGKPTKNCISQASGVFYVYIGDDVFAMADSLREAKDMLIDALGIKDYLPKHWNGEVGKPNPNYKPKHAR